MSAAPANAEHLLCAAYREEAILYDRALTIATDVLTALRRGDHAEESLRQLLAIFDQVSNIEARLAPVKARCAHNDAKPGPALEHAITEVRHLAERVQACIQEAERFARERKSELEPQLDAVIRGSQMQRAYGNWR